MPWKAITPGAWAPGTPERRERENTDASGLYEEHDARSGMLGG